MKTSEFTFKKTRRVKQVDVHHAISIDLTVKEAADLVAYLQAANTPDFRYQGLLDALRSFTQKHIAVSDLKCSYDKNPSGFVMVYRAT